MAEQLLVAKEQPPNLLVTDAYSEHRLSQIQDNLAIFINNIILYCKLEQKHILEAEQTEALIDLLRSQLNQLWFEDKLKSLQKDLRVENEKYEQQPFQKKLFQLQQLIRAESQKKNAASSQEKYVHYERQVNEYIQIIQGFISAKSVKEAIDAFEMDENSKEDISSASKDTSQIHIPSAHYIRELINTKINYGPNVFNFIQPQNHQHYITQAAKVYNQVAPFKIKHIALSITDGPVINRPNYFQQDLDESKVIISICLPGTNKLGYYFLSDLCKVHTFGKELYHQKVLTNDWNFSPYTRSITTPNGKIYAINCRTTKNKIDSYLYEIGQDKASNRGPLPSPKRQSSILYMNGNIYVIGGQADGQKCSKKSYCYSLKQKKWHQLCDSNVALRKATVCTVNNRYILKLGGLNEFDYINKIIEMYDSLTDRWSLVRASPRNILEQVQILQDSHAVQINDDQVYIFGGKNANKFSTDTGFVLVISQIRQKRKGAAKVNGQFWNVSVGKRNILTFLGQFSLTSVVLHHNSIYGLRSDVAKTISP